MKVWLLHNFSHGEVYVYAEDTDVTEIQYVKDELGYLLDCGDEYQDEYNEFFADVESAKSRGNGSAGIEERFRLELVEVK